MDAGRVNIQHPYGLFISARSANHHYVPFIETEQLPGRFTRSLKPRQKRYDPIILTGNPLVNRLYAPRVTGKPISHSTVASLSNTWFSSATVKSSEREVPVKSFFTSSLDQVDPPTPFVNAMNWESYRRQFQSAKSGKSGNRNCGLASVSLNPDSVELSNTTSRGHDISMIVQNTTSSRYRIEVLPKPESLSSNAVDLCFGALNLEFLPEKPISLKPFKGLKDKGLENSVWSFGDSYEKELGLLESVQEIAMALVRTTPKRSAPISEVVDLR